MPWTEILHPGCRIDALEENPKFLHSRFGAYVRFEDASEKPLRKVVSDFLACLKAFTLDKSSDAGCLLTFCPFPCVRLLNAADECAGTIDATGPSSEDIGIRFELFLADCEKHDADSVRVGCAAEGVDLWAQCKYNCPPIGEAEGRMRGVKANRSQKSRVACGRSRRRWGRVGWSKLDNGSADDAAAAADDDQVDNVETTDHTSIPKHFFVEQMSHLKCLWDETSGGEKSIELRVNTFRAKVESQSFGLAGCFISFPPSLSTRALSALVNPFHFPQEIPRDVKRLLMMTSPALASHLRPHQLTAISEALTLPSKHDGISHRRRALGRMLFADEMGLGKTLQALGAVAGLAQLSQLDPNTPSPFPLLIVCPASVRPMWCFESSQWLSPYFPPLQAGRDREDLPECVDVHPVWGISGHDTKVGLRETPSVVVVSKQLLGALFEVDIGVRSWGSIIVDESHQMHTTLAGAGESCCKTTRCISDLCRRTRFVLMLSGTPSLATPFDMYQQLSALRPDLFGESSPTDAGLTFVSKEDFGFAYTEALVGHCGGGYLRFGRCTRISELRKILDECFWIRREKKDLINTASAQGVDGDALAQTPSPRITGPGVTRIVVKLKCGDETPGGEERENEDDLSETDQEVCQQVVDADCASMTPYHSVGLRKVAVLAPLLRKVIRESFAFVASDREGRVVLFTHHIDVQDRVLEAASEIVTQLGGVPSDVIRRIDGTTPLPVRDLILEQFQNASSKVHILIAAITACGVGVSQMAGSRIAVFCELPPNVSWLLQAEGRLARPKAEVSSLSRSREHPREAAEMCTVYVCVADDSAVDRRHWSRLQRGFRDVSAMMVGSGDTETRSALTPMRRGSFGDSHLSGLEGLHLAQAVHMTLLEINKDTQLGSIVIGCRQNKFHSGIDVLTMCGSVRQIASFSKDVGWAIARAPQDVASPLRTAVIRAVSDFLQLLNRLTSHQKRQQVVKGEIFWSIEASSSANPNGAPAEEKKSSQALSLPWGAGLPENMPELPGNCRPPRYVKSEPTRGLAIVVPVTVNGIKVSTTHSVSTIEHKDGRHSILCLECNRAPLPLLRLVDKETAASGRINWEAVAPASFATSGVTSPYLYLFCSGACKEQYFIVRGSAGIRKVVGRYDAGICNNCGLDGTALLAEVQGTDVSRRDQVIVARQPEFSDFPLLLDRLIRAPTAGNVWHADHTVPVRAGGGMAGMENLQTLCVVCHAIKTRSENKLYSTKNTMK